MSDKPQPAGAGFFALPDHHVISLHGRDAIAFAQAQTMNDVAALADGQWQWSGWLTPKGRVIALFALLRRDAETVWLLLPDTDPQPLSDALRRFVFRSKVAISARDDLAVAGAFASPTHASGAESASMDDGGIELDLGGAGGPRRLSISRTRHPTEPERVAHWDRYDLAHGLPRLPATQRERWTPQQLSLERVHAYSVKKGCYPGQEIVARTHFLGQSKRGLVRVQGAGVGQLAEILQSGTLDSDGGGSAQLVRSIGEVVCARGDEGLGILPIDAGDEPLVTAGQPCNRLPLLPGLAR